jgi:large subunit ribosomal protein L24
MKNPGSIRKGDTVKILTGKDRGKQGKVIQVFPKQEKVVVEGINLSKRHLRPRKQGEKGQRVEFSAPIHASNVRSVEEKPKAEKQSRARRTVPAPKPKKLPEPEQKTTKEEKPA